MNKATRLLAMTGMALVAGVTMGAGSASAATKTPAPGPGHEKVVGYYRSPLACERAGRIGEIRDKWESHDCTRVRFGFHRGLWKLSVSWGHGPFGHGHGHGPIHGPGPFHPGHGPIISGHGPVLPGHGPVLPGHSPVLPAHP